MTHGETAPPVLQAIFRCGLLALLVLTVPACVSVQKNGQKQQAPDPQVAMVEFNSTKDPAEVYVDGDFRGSTPVRLQLTTGAHTVEYRLAGYQPWTRKLVVVAGDRTRVTAVLLPE